MVSQSISRSDGQLVDCQAVRPMGRKERGREWSWAGVQGRERGGQVVLQAACVGLASGNRIQGRRSGARPGANAGAAR